MSSRALRRAQKELEERQRLEEATRLEEEEDDDDDVAPPIQKSSLFAMLGEAEKEGEEEEVEEEASAEEETTPKPVLPAPKGTKKSKKKKKKGKGKAKASAPAPDPRKSSHSSKEITSGMDEIDRALLALDIKSSGGEDTSQQTQHISEEIQQLCSVLSVDTQHLQAANEMRKLFGRAAVQTNQGDDGARRRGRGHPQGGIAGAVAGRNAPGQRNVPSIGLRKNIFMPGKEEWPRATTGGLGMEVVSKNNDGTVEYRFVHNRTYQSVQQEFEVCVASMDPDRMVQLLQFNRKTTPRNYQL